MPTISSIFCLFSTIFSTFPKSRTLISLHFGFFCPKIPYNMAPKKRKISRHFGCFCPKIPYNIEPKMKNIRTWYFFLWYFFQKYHQNSWFFLPILAENVSIIGITLFPLDEWIRLLVSIRVFFSPLVGENSPTKFFWFFFPQLKKFPYLKK